MQFKVTAKVESLIKSGQSKFGDWYLYSISEVTEKSTKHWRIFTKADLILQGVYNFEGYISESPNNAYKSESGKVAYQSTYNVTDFLLVSSQPGKDIFKDVRESKEPVFNANDEIPF